VYEILLGDYFAVTRNDTVDMVWTDPPYFLSNGGDSVSGGKRVSVDKGDWDQSPGPQGKLQFNLKWLSKTWEVLKPGGSIWISGTMHNAPYVGVALEQVGYQIVNLVVWEKTNPPPNLGCRCLTHSNELLYWAKKPGRHTYNYHDMKALTGKQMKDVWRLPAVPRSEKSHGKHPTQKPLALVERCILATSLPGDLIMDPFMGSGTTGVAATQNGRRFLGVESDPEYFHLAHQRISQCLTAKTI